MTTKTTSFHHKGLDWLQDKVAEVLNELYDPADIARCLMLADKNKKIAKLTKGPAEVARDNALANARKKIDKLKKKEQGNLTDEEFSDKFQEKLDAIEKEKQAKLKKIAEKHEEKQENEGGLQAKIDAAEKEKQTMIEEAVASAVPFTRQDAKVHQTTKIEEGDFRVDAALTLAKALGVSPFHCASQIANALMRKVAGMGILDDSPQVVQTGFIYLRYHNDYLSKAVGAMAADANGRLALAKTVEPQKIIVDYSSPNIAKELHVGHLRSTIIGDTLANLLEFLGHDVVRLNHVGDWGTQFGMLLEHLRDNLPQALDIETSGNVNVGDLVVLYKAAKKRFDEDDDFRTRARQCVVRLQAGNAEEIAAWKALCATSRIEYEEIYDLLNINEGLTERGESFYNPYLQDTIDKLRENDMVEESEGAMVVFLNGYKNKDGSPKPVIVQKSDGGFNYTTTDLAAIRYRTMFENGDKADRVIYVTDIGQSKHFVQEVFPVAKLAGFVPETCSLEHVPFGFVQGENGKKLATRSGDTEKLRDLLDEAVRQALIAGKHPLLQILLSMWWSAMSVFLYVSVLVGSPKLDSMATVTTARVVGIAAVKYADLSTKRESDYPFSYDRMLSLKGNTAPYMLYAYARICGIIRKVNGQDNGGDGKTPLEWPEAANIVITHAPEKELARTLVKLQEVINRVELDLYPHRLCDFLFELSQQFNKFYHCQSCDVKNETNPELKASRFTLCTTTAATIRMLLALLGIEVVENL